MARLNPINILKDDKMSGLWKQGTQGLEIWAGPVIDFMMRLMIANVFWKSGLTKISDWDSTLMLFEYEYMVPILPPEIAALFGTAFELLCPVLLFLGLFTRLGAVPLLVMSLVIQFVLGASNPAYDHVEHFYWMLLLGAIIIRGPGKISLDYLLGLKFKNWQKS